MGIAEFLAVQFLRFCAAPARQLRPRTRAGPAPAIGSGWPALCNRISNLQSTISTGIQDNQGDHHARS